MNYDYNLLSVSFFINKSYWQLLLNKTINPVLDCLNREDLIKTYLLELNYSNGENVRLGLLSRDNQGIMEQVSLYSQHFFFTTGISGRTRLDVKYDLFSPVELKGPEALEKCNLSIGLSHILLEVLQQDEANEEGVITIAFYLKMALIKVVFNNNMTSAEDLLRLYSYNLSNLLVSHDFLRLKYEENKQLLLEIYVDIVNQQHLPDWVNRWMQLCTAEIRNNSGLTITRSNSLIFNRIVYLIYKHLGINENEGLVLYYFMKQVLMYNSFVVFETKA